LQVSVKHMVCKYYRVLFTSRKKDYKALRCETYGS
jgi:hypothetical protein